MTDELDRFVKFIENGGIITDVTMYNCLYAELESKIEVFDEATEWRNKWQNKMYDFEHLESQVAKLEHKIIELNRGNIETHVMYQSQLEQYKAVIDKIKEFVRVSNIRYYSEFNGLKAILDKLNNK